MKLRLGQQVQATDGLFGELGDIIIDPIEKRVTHIVAQPRHKHQEARLVPMWLVSEDAGRLSVALDVDHVRQLGRVSYTDYVKAGEPLDVGDDWDIGTQHVFSLPYHELEFDKGWYDERIGVSFDRIPKGECEIRRTSQVLSADGTSLGAVHGLVADHGHVHAIVVRSGVPGLRHDVLVPLGSVESIRTDEVELMLTEDQFGLLPRTEVLGASDEDLGAHIIDLRRRAASASGRIAHMGRSLVSSARDQFDKRV